MRRDVKRDRDKATTGIIEQAADWVVRLHEDASMPTAERRAFLTWLRKSPVHVREFLQAEADWLALEGVDATHGIDVAALLADRDANVMPLHESTSARLARTRQRRGHRVIAGLAAAVLAAVAMAVYVLIDTQSTGLYVTALGEQRAIVLSDGSVVELNTQSRIKVRFDGELRDVDLLAGEALFTVEDDPARPFRVFSGSVEVQAVGTQFNVYRQAEQTVVTVLEGRVAVRQHDVETVSIDTSGGPPAVLSETVELAVGEQAVVQAEATLRQVTTRPTRAVAWRERRLVFENETLANVAAEFNRYNAQRIVIEGDALRARRINGVFNADRPERIVQFIMRSKDVELIEIPGEEWRLVGPSSSE